MRVGIMGGTFNPIHYGHLLSAEEVRERFKLEKVIFIPLSLPPHKGAHDVIDARHRLEMVRRAVASNPRFEVSTVEIDRGGISYTVDTLEELRRRSSPETEFFFIMGADSFLEISTWKDVPRLFQLCNFIVTVRDGFPLDHLVGTLVETVGNKYPELRFTLRDESPAQGEISVEGSPCAIYPTPISSLEISSTKIRRRVGSGRSIKYLLPPRVEEYILNNNLYSE
ncbi:MAG: nicotinate-nucleotide adenylyltransferase [Nitrospinota bacterium]